ncbi:hypothetical protein SCHPADRAFT_678106 [Schizopora paradoxa]|uniref:Uncharacterized protein n=1 Tax=Schizopora paradoxa TaxID=27342 RepID=A0A0H2R628_9AGAM|nr:hypothetical protein SCHPADRAFT_678106 [Schizopora paradoxa]
MAAPVWTKVFTPPPVLTYVPCSPPSSPDCKTTRKDKIAAAVASAVADNVSRPLVFVPIRMEVEEMRKKIDDEIDDITPVTPSKYSALDDDQTNFSDENRGRVSYSSPEREAEIEELLERVKHLADFGELIPIVRRILELEDEEHEDRCRRAEMGENALNGAAYRGYWTSAPMWPETGDDMKKSDHSADAAGDQSLWQDDDSFDFGEPLSSEELNAMGTGVFILPLGFGMQDDSDDDSDTEMSPRRPSVRRSRPSLGSH